MTTIIIMCCAKWSLNLSVSSVNDFSLRSLNQTVHLITKERVHVITKLFSKISSCQDHQYILRRNSTIQKNTNQYQQYINKYHIRMNNTLKHHTDTNNMLTNNISALIYDIIWDYPSTQHLNKLPHYMIAGEQLELQTWEQQYF